MDRDGDIQRGVRSAEREEKHPPAWVFLDRASGKDGKIQEEHNTGARHNQALD